MLTACASQVRTIGMDGAVIGLDQPAVLQAADAWGYDRGWVMRLLPYAEKGLVEAIGEQRRRGQDDDGEDG